MKLNEFDQIPHVDVEEVRMSPSALSAFAKTSIAKSMTMGFEAELLVPGVPDPSQKEGHDDQPIVGQNAKNIAEEIAEFFEQTHGYIWTYNKVLDYMFENMPAKMKQDRLDFEKTNNFKDKIRAGIKSLQNDYSKPGSSVDKSIENQDGYYQVALKNEKHDWLGNWSGIRDWIDNENLDRMIEWSYVLDLTWPVYDDELAWQEMTEFAADDFRDHIGMEVVVSHGHGHEPREPGRWIMEQDESIQTDMDEYGGVELVSPPMQLETAMSKFETFWNWAVQYGCRTNDTTGFHVGVSFPTAVQEDIDYLKLILFLGDEQLLQSFGRLGSSYARSSVAAIRREIKMSAKVNPDDVSDTLLQMRLALSTIAKNKVLKAGLERSTYDKYVSVHIKPRYIEFRSAGGNYLANKKGIKETILRYVRAMALAADPLEAKEEYAKKLYKLIDDSLPEKDEVSKLVAQYGAGLISKAVFDYKMANKMMQYKPVQVEKPTESYTTEQVSEAATVEDLLNRYKDWPGGANKWIANHAKKLDSVIANLKKSPYAPAIKIFGSAAEPNDLMPQDIDILIDSRGIDLGPDAAMQAAAHVMALASNYYGFLDPYLLAKDGKLWTRDDRAEKWIKAKNQNKILADGTHGIPLAMFDKNFTSLAYKGLAESRQDNPLKESIEQVYNTRLKSKYSDYEIALMLGGHSTEE